MTRRFFSGKTLDQAVMMAARHYEIDPEALAYRQIEKKHGFLRTRKAVMIAVDPDQPRREQQAAESNRGVTPTAAAPVPERPIPEAPIPETRAPERPVETPPAAQAPPQVAVPGPPVTLAAVVESAAEIGDDDWDSDAEEPDDEEPEAPAPTAPVRRPPARTHHTVDHDEELLGAAEDATRRLMRFAGIEGEASAQSGGERVEVEVEGADATVLVVEDGKGLLAIQHLLPRMLRGLTGRSSFVRVDSQGFHQQRRERLEALALKEAEAASRGGTPRTLPPMAPDERRIVHLALQDDPTVETESRGTGLHKRIVVRPVSGDGGVDDIEARHGF